MNATRLFAVGSPPARPIGRLGLFGGSFDPPHQAHLALARSALAQLRLDELRWLPAGQPWQKRRPPLAAAHRAAMVAAAIAHEPRWRLDQRELERAGPSYTIDSVRELQREQPQAELFLVIGQDQYQQLDSWHAWRELLAAVTLAVAGRGDAPLAAPAALQQVPHRVELLSMPPMPVSATAIRAHLAAGRPARELAPALVPAEVASYIDQHHLYRH